MSKNWTEREWREHVEKRRQGSAIWQVIHALASLRLAMILLFVLIVACAVATLYESKFSTQVAQAYVYKSPYFIFWLLILCINLFAVTLTRWPWQKRHFGFVITHFGIIILLIGGAVGQKTGFEGSVTLDTNANPTRQVVLNRTVLQVDYGVVDRISFKVPLPVDVGAPTQERPKRFSIPESNLKLVVDDYSDNLISATELISSPLPNVGPGVSLEFSSSMMGRNTVINLASKPTDLSRNEFFGRAVIELVEALPDRSGAKPLEGAFSEAQMVFEKSEPVITPRSGNAAEKPSGYRVGLVLDRDAKEPVPHLLIQTPKGHREVFELANVIGKPISLHGDSTRIVVREYWPDFEMKEGTPSTKSQNPNYPAVLVTLETDGTAELPLLELAPGGEGIAFQMSRGGVLRASGKAKVGEAFSLGWADWTATLKAVYPEALLKQFLVPAEEGGSEEGITGVRAYLWDSKANVRGEPAWIPSGKGVTLRLGEQTVFVGFGLEVYSLPFTLKLEKFEVPRGKGGGTPIDFRSTVRFDDSITGETVTRLIHMNHPASFPISFWQTALGTNYKFSQANWNPKNLNETTLQVLHDPGWSFKWIGSLLTCVGIGVMFYLKPAKKPSQKRKNKEAIV